MNFQKNNISSETPCILSILRVTKYVVFVVLVLRAKALPIWAGPYQYQDSYR